VEATYFQALLLPLPPKKYRFRRFRFHITDGHQASFGTEMVTTEDKQRNKTFGMKTSGNCNKIHPKSQHRTCQTIGMSKINLDSNWTTDIFLFLASLSIY
jgi:hypothetical protein